jgi:hypothetical protein
MDLAAPGWHDILMARLWSLLIALGLVAIAAPADAQVFKPKGKKSETSAKKTTKKTPKKAATKKKAGKKKGTAKRDRDDGSESASKGDFDFVEITDDEEIE